MTVDHPAPTASRRTPPKVPRPAPAPRVPDPLLDGLARQVQAGGDPGHLARRFWVDHGARSPLVHPADADGHHVVTFLWRDATAHDVLLFVNRLTDERDLAASLMHRVPRTDVWHLSYRMRADWRASYAVLPHRPGARPPWLDGTDQVAVRAGLDQGLADPLNPLQVRNRAGVRQSVVELPGAPVQRWVRRRPHVARGDLTPCTLPDGARAWTYRAAGVDGPAPLLVAFDGEVWTSSHRLADTLDNLVADGDVPPLCAVLLDSGGRDRRWEQLDDGSRTPDHVADVVLPWARGHLPVADGPAQVVVAGQSLGALGALATVVDRPDAVGCAVSQSASLWQDALMRRTAAAAPAPRRVHLEVGLQEWVLLEPHRRFARLLRGTGAEVHQVEFNGGHDYACWRGGVADGLRWVARGWA